MRSGLDDKTPDKTPVKIDPRIYDSYVGRYEFVTRATVSIYKEGDRLFFSGGLGGKSELIPKSENEFINKNQPMRFTFVKDEKGRLTHLVRRSRFGEGLTFDMKARKIE